MSWFLIHNSWIYCVWYSLLICWHFIKEVIYFLCFKKCQCFLFSAYSLFALLSLLNSINSHLKITTYFCFTFYFQFKNPNLFFTTLNVHVSSLERYDLSLSVRLFVSNLPLYPAVSAMELHFCESWIQLLPQQEFTVFSQESSAPDASMLRDF